MTANGSYWRSRGPLGQGVPVSPLRRGKTRKRWVRRAVRTTLIAAALVGGAILVHGGLDFIHSDGAFGIRQIHIVGLTQHEPGLLRDRLADLRGRNLFGLKPQDISQRIGDCAWLKGFLCRKHLPDTLIVEVVERQDLCAVTTDAGVFAIDGRGVCWPALPGVPGLLKLARGLAVEDPAVQSLVASVLAQGLSRTVTALAPGPEPGSYALSTQDGWTVVVSPDDLTAQWRRFESVRSYAATYVPDRRGVDCRWAGKAVLLPPPPTDSETAPADRVEGGNENG